MVDFRLYRLRANNSIVDFIDIPAASDKEATIEAIKLDHAEIMEIWQGERLVSRVDPAPKR
jgi:hypothetical protein